MRPLPEHINEGTAMMNSWINFMEDDPRHHTGKIKSELSRLIENNAPAWK